MRDESLHDGKNKFNNECGLERKNRRSLKMTKNIPGSRRKRRSLRLRKMGGSQITVAFGRIGERGQHETVNEETGLLTYVVLPPSSGGDRGYVFDGPNTRGRMYIKKMERVDTKNKLIRYLIN